MANSNLKVHVEIVNGTWTSNPSVRVIRDKDAAELPVWFQKGTREPKIGDILATYSGYRTLYVMAPENTRERCPCCGDEFTPLSGVVGQACKTCNEEAE